MVRGVESKIMFDIEINFPAISKSLRPTAVTRTLLESVPATTETTVRTPEREGTQEVAGTPEPEGTQPRQGCQQKQGI